jgi:hypothetical protein
MARRLGNNGSAMIEAAGVIAVFAVLVCGVLLAAFLFVARAWIQSQSEQALYCLATTSRPSNCQRNFKTRIEGFLPWGGVTHSALWNQADNWSLNVTWRWKGFKWTLNKGLSIRAIQKNRASLLSPH